MQPAAIQNALDRTLDRDPRVRRTALLDLCPCRVRTEVPVVWDRLLEMKNDPELSVRSLVLHSLCDGSPRSREREVVAAAEDLARDSDRGLRRRARGILAAYRRTGTINQE